MSEENVEEKNKKISPWMVDEMTTISTSLTSLTSAALLGCLPPKTLRWRERNARSFSQENFLSNSLPSLHNKSNGLSSKIQKNEAIASTMSRTIATQTPLSSNLSSQSINERQESKRLRRSSFTDWQRMGQELRHIADDLRRSTNSLDSTSSTESPRHFFSANFIAQKNASKNRSINDVRRSRHFSFGAKTNSNEKLAFKKK